MNQLINRLTNLLSIKSLITLVMLAVFTCLTLTGKAVTTEFMDLFKMVIIFYFGTQAVKESSK